MTLRPFDEVVAEHGEVVLRVCRALLGPIDADDAWSETFLSAMRAYPSVREHSNIRGWLVTIAHNRAIDQIRRTQRQPLPTGALPELHALDQDWMQHDDLRAALDALPPKQRCAVIYRHLADMAYAEIAELLQCSEPAARRSAADGIAALRDHYSSTNRMDTP